MGWSERKELTEGQMRAAQYAGIPADRPGLLDTYPRAVYKVGDGTVLNGQPFLIHGVEVRCSTVGNAQEESEAKAQGWHLTPEEAATAPDKNRIPA